VNQNDKKGVALSSHIQHTVSTMWPSQNDTSQRTTFCEKIIIIILVSQL